MIISGEFVKTDSRSEVKRCSLQNRTSRVWTIQAANDLEHIYEYIAKDSVKYARIEIRRIQDRVKLLKRHPKSGRIFTEIEVK
jgi:plasmid stabilization system protein ParE